MKNISDFMLDLKMSTHDIMVVVIVQVYQISTDYFVLIKLFYTKTYIVIAKNKKFAEKSYKVYFLL